MKKKMKKILLVALLLAGAVAFGARQTRAEVVEAKKGQTYTGEYAVIVNTSQERSESSGTLQFVSESKNAQAVQEDSPRETSQSILQEETASLYNVQHMSESRVVGAKAGVSYKVGDIRKGRGYPDGTAIEQNYVCIGEGEHCYIWMEMNLMQSYQKQGLLSAIARETAQVYDGEPYTVLNTLCSGSFPAQDGSGKLSILLETDIRMNGSENFTVPSFSGVLDGNGHTIYGLRRPLAADNTGTIQNLLAEAAEAQPEMAAEVQREAAEERPEATAQIHRPVSRISTGL